MKSQHLAALSAVFCSVSASTAGLVVNTADNGPGSLRQAIADVPLDGAETITFAPELDASTITLTSGPLIIDHKNPAIDASALRSGLAISGNSSSRIFTISSATVILRNLKAVHGSETSDKGGCIAASQSVLTIDRCSIQNGYSLKDGGGIWLSYCSGSLVRCHIAGNSTGTFGGGICVIGGGPLTLSNCQISGNFAPLGNGGGIYLLASSPQILQCTIQGNEGNGVTHIAGASPTVRNSILWGNTYTSGTLAAQQVRNLTSLTPLPHPDIAQCLIEGANSAASFNDGNLTTWGSGNLDGTMPANEPRFVAPNPASSAPNAASDLRLLATSPALNCGDNTWSAESLDLSGRPRIQQGTVDLGAFEGTHVSFASLHPALDPTGDSNANGLTNFAEYALGLDPAAPTDPTAMPAILRAGSSLILSGTQRSNATDTQPLWETSTNLAPDSWTPLLQGTHYDSFAIIQLSDERQRLELLLSTASAPSSFFRQGFRPTP